MPAMDPYAPRPLSAGISVQEMYKYSKLPNTDYGIEGYDVPNIHFDHLKKKEDDENWKYNTFGKRKKRRAPDSQAKREGMNKDIEIRAKNTPGPWTYDIKQEWIHGPRKKLAEEVPGKERQQLKFKWKGVPSDEREFERPKKIHRKKLDMSVGIFNCRSRKKATSII